ncbi:MULTISPECIES: stage II sporulation protein M [unclassified Leptolyngbya]|uniref:stage II sporulation protein M n=1 Tax=unclassified Leptolyngbya TaxID=2650499 RepID=UPI00168A09A3|nr:MULTISPECIES: stage II sporulation protein M [unclassified Leptolyngbya]MBD1914140.1 stage II sporulation protein M [Leptolyngbya sp. FACHB-8]MBD2155910.1 stage II sporulation protein M [Leptolyngbya sp. FACHB-16]
MNIQRWVARREPNWKQLAELLNRAEKRGLNTLSASDIQRLASLYRSVSADLARARTHRVGNLIVQDLQSLTTRSYNQVYQGSRKQEWQAVLDFYRWGLPEVVQASAGYIAVAIALFLIGALVAWWFAWTDPAFLPLVVPANIISQVRDEQQLWMGSIVGVEPFASSSIMINNIRVCFSAIAGGIVAGLGTTYIMLLNGALLGAIGTLVAQGNLAFPFWAFVFPHGSLELPAIFMAGGSGLLLGRALLFPGRYRRMDALKIYGQQAARLVYGVVPMLVIAGLIEGFFSPNPAIPDAAKYLVGIGLLIGLVVYLGQRRP